jgi:UDP-glucose 4-epimerase
LLGAQIERLLPREVPGATSWLPDSAGFSWNEPTRLARELGDAAQAFGRAVERRRSRWMVLWCAGSGGVGTAPGALVQETGALHVLLGHLSVNLVRRLGPSPGLLLLCSSAGGVYGDSVDLPLTEDSPCVPISEYGRNKLHQEANVRRWVDENPGVSCLVARISNLYGPARLRRRAPGLIDSLAEALIHRRALNVYVPLDTLRDFLYAEDAARYILRSVDRLRSSDSRPPLIKIFAAEHSVSIAEIIGIFSRVAKRAPRIVCMPHAMNRQQPDRLRFRSRVWTDLAPPARDLAAGIRAVYHDRLSVFQRGESLPPDDSRAPTPATGRPHARSD